MRFPTVHQNMLPRYLYYILKSYSHDLYTMIWKFDIISPFLQIKILRLIGVEDAQEVVNVTTDCILVC